MDIVFGSEGVGRSDLDRMDTIRHEIGLNRILGEIDNHNNGDVSPSTEQKGEGGREKIHEL